MDDTFEGLNERLIRAILHGDVHDVIGALDDGAYIDFEDANAQTPLMIAAEVLNYDAVKELLNRGADRNLRDHEGMNAFDLAKLHVHNKRDTKYLELLALLAPQMDITKTRNKVLLDVVSNNNDYNIERVIELLDYGADPNYQDPEDGQTPLILATKIEGIEEDEILKMIKVLLDRGADPNIEDNLGATALTYAAMNSELNLIKELLDRGANVNHQDSGRWTALMLASEYGHFSMLKLLLDRGADLNLQNENEDTALLLAVEQGDNGRYLIDIVKELLERGADPNLRNAKGKRAFDLAKGQGGGYYTNQEIIKLLKVDPSIVDPNTGVSNLEKLASNDPAMLEEIIDQVEDLNHQDLDGNTPLIYAIVNGKVKNVELLLDRGADPNRANFGGGTPLAYAIASNQKKIEEMLIEAGAR